MFSKKILPTKLTLGVSSSSSKSIFIMFILVIGCVKTIHSSKTVQTQVYFNNFVKMVHYYNKLILFWLAYLSFKIVQLFFKLIQLLICTNVQFYLNSRVAK